MDHTDPTNPAPEADAPETQEVETELDQEAAETDETAEGEQEIQDEFIELEHDGKRAKLPKWAEPLVMFQKDYTQKTQSLAEQRRADDAQRQAHQWEVETRQALFKEESELYSIRQRLDQYSNVNWQQAWAENPQQAGAWQAEYTQLKDYHDRLHGHVEGRKSELSRKREQETANAIRSAVETLSKPNPEFGWDGKLDADKRASLTKFGMEMGYSDAELSATNRPAFIHLLNLAMIGRETLRSKTATLKKVTPEAKPVPQVGAGKSTATVNPDKLPMDQWVKAERARMAKAGRFSR